MIEKTAPDIIVDAGLLERRDLRAVHCAHDLGVDIHRQAVQRVFGEDDQIHGAHVAPRLGRHLDNAGGLGGQIVRRFHHWQLELHQSDHHAVW